MYLNEDYNEPVDNHSIQEALLILKAKAKMINPNKSFFNSFIKTIFRDNFEGVDVQNVDIGWSVDENDAVLIIDDNYFHDSYMRIILRNDDVLFVNGFMTVVANADGLLFYPCWDGAANKPLGIMKEKMTWHNQNVEIHEFCNAVKDFYKAWRNI